MNLKTAKALGLTVPPTLLACADEAIEYGAEPGDIPIEPAAKFKLVLNLKTAKALDLTVASSFLARTDKVIE